MKASSSVSISHMLLKAGAATSSATIVSIYSIDLYLYYDLQNGATALMMASGKGRDAVVKLLLKHMASVDQRDKVKYSDIFAIVTLLCSLGTLL